MSYLVSLGLLVVGLLLLVAVLVRALGPARRLTSTAARLTAQVNTQTNRLRARSAALGVAFRQRRGRAPETEMALRVPSEEHAQTGGRP